MSDGIILPESAVEQEQPDESVLTCRTCRHWVRQPYDPNNLGQGEMGECRGAPPAMAGIVTGQDRLGNLQLQFVTRYPPVKGDFLACRLHEKSA